jgi:hypothetical protein
VLRHDPTLHVFIDDGGEPTLTSIGKPFQGSGVKLVRFGAKLLAIPLDFKAQAKDNAIYAYSPETQTWQLMTREEIAFEMAIHFGAFELASMGECNPHRYLAFAGDYIATANCVFHKGQLIFDAQNTFSVGEYRVQTLYPLVIDPKLNVWGIEARHKNGKKLDALLMCKSGALPSAKGCQVEKLPNKGEIPYASVRSQNRGIVSTNGGAIYGLNSETGKLIELRKSNGKSFQLYGTVAYGDHILVGQYPQGLLLDLANDNVEMLPDQLEYAWNRYKSGAEIQTLTQFKGDVLAGVWPFGEVYKRPNGRRDFQLAHRLFEEPQISPEEAEPYLNHIKSNLLGQRINALVPMGDSVYIATGSKEGLVLNEKTFSLPQDTLNRYGEIYRLKNSGVTTADLRKYIKGSVTLEIEINDSKLTIREKDGRTLATADVGSKLGCSTAKTEGKGVFGGLVGASASVKVIKNELDCQNALAISSSVVSPTTTAPTAAAPLPLTVLPSLPLIPVADVPVTSSVAPEMPSLEKVSEPEKRSEVKKTGVIAPASESTKP